MLTLALRFFCTNYFSDGYFSARNDNLILFAQTSFAKIQILYDNSHITIYIFAKMCYTDFATQVNNCNLQEKCFYL